jgi:glycogen operon protein
MTAPDWADASALAVALYLDGADDPDRAADGSLMVDDDFLVLVNAWWEPLEFVLPATREQSAWRVELDSHDLTSPAGSAAARRSAGDRVAVGPRSIAVLGARRPAE